jgi:hypothetical protein
MGFELEGFAFMVGSYNAYSIVKILLDINDYLFFIFGLIIILFFLKSISKFNYFFS